MGKYRLITDFSFPQGRSVNDGITAALTSLSYITVDSVAHMAQCLGQGFLLARMDIEAAHTGPDVAGSGIGRKPLRRPHAAIWPPIGTKDF